MREALRRLQATGMIDIRHGSGIYVLRAEQRLVVANPGYGDLETHTILQILDARLLVEPHLAELAASNIDPATLAAIAQIIQQAADEVRLREYMDSNVRFHTLIARASGNLVLAQIIESLIELYSVELDHVDPNLMLVDGRAADNAVHQEIYASLAARDERAAYDAMSRHLQAAFASVASRLSPESRVQSPSPEANLPLVVTDLRVLSHPALAVVVKDLRVLSCPGAAQRLYADTRSAPTNLARVPPLHNLPAQASSSSPAGSIRSPRNVPTLAGRPAAPESVIETGSGASESNSARTVPGSSPDSR